MNRRLTILVSGAVALVIFVAGCAYALLRTQDYKSCSALALVPALKDPRDIGNLTSSFNNSDTIGTYVEFIASADTLKRAGSPNVDLAVRGVPDARVIDVCTQGAQDKVQPALTSVVDTVRANQSNLNDAWNLDVIQGAQAPAKTGPETVLILGASVLLALLGGLFVFVMLSRFVGFDAPRSPPPAAGYGGDGEDDPRSGTLTGAGGRAG